MISSLQSSTKQYVDGKVLKFYTGKYNGTDSYGKNNPKSITFPFKPILFIGPHSYDVRRSTVIFCDEIPVDNYATSYWFENSQVGMKNQPIVKLFIGLVILLVLNVMFLVQYTITQLLLNMV